MSAALIETRELEKTYRLGVSTVRALRNVSLRIDKGEYVAVMGPSGSGKSTLLHLLGCLDVPSAGVYRLAGHDVGKLDDVSLAMLRARRIGFVFQTFHLIPQFTVLENVLMPFLYRGGRGEDPGERARRALEEVGLSHRVSHRPAELSGGEMQRVAIARALAGDPLLLLADEPTGNLDSETGSGILDLFDKLNANGMTIVLVTHDEAAGARCGRCIRLRDGVLVQ